MGDERIEFPNTAVIAAQRAGRIILENLGHISKNDIGLKKESDFVTRVDRESERIIINGGDNYLSPGNIVAGAPVIHKELLGEVKKVFAGIISE